MKKRLPFIFFDNLLLFVSFYFFVFLKYNRLFIQPGTLYSVLYFILLWFIISLLSGKYRINHIRTFNSLLSSIALSNLLTLGFVVILIRISKPFVDFRFIIIYSLFFATALELLAGYIFFLIKKAVEAPYFPEEAQSSNPIPFVEKKETVEKTLSSDLPTDEIIEYDQTIDLNSIIIEETDVETLKFIQRYFSRKISDTLIMSTTTRFNLVNQPRSKYEVIINLKRVNDFQYINKFFESVNSKLNNGGIFIDWVETYSQRKARFFSKYPFGLNYLLYTLDFIIHRILPKLDLTKGIYFTITQGKNRVISKAETFGRLYSCGFEIIDEQFINNRLFFIVRKHKEPSFDPKPTYGPIIKLQRVGKNGKIIGVFKFRTMHAYSEYLQDYIYKKNALDDGGKFKDDFRITTIGKIFRAFWIDELPMLINVFIFRNMKIVGVRPLSQHYFSLYSDDLKQKRIVNKPGLVPPYYAQFPTPKSLEDIQANEIAYLNEYEKHPFTTDVKYFFKAFYNILFKRARSS